MVIFKAQLALTALLTCTAMSGVAASPAAAQPALSLSERLYSRRAQILKRLKYHSPRQLRPRASGAPCLTVLDDDNECCLYNALDSQGSCCTAEDVYSPQCGEVVCCDDGVVFGNGGGFPEGESFPTGGEGCCRPPGVVYDQGSQCCTSGLVDGQGTCCSSGQTIVNNVCTSPFIVTRHRTRDINPDSYMVKRHEKSARMVLSPDLMAELLVNNGAFTHDGIEHLDVNYRGHNAGVLRRLAGRGISSAINLAFREGADYDADMWNSMEYMAISESYEFAVKDVPEIYARVVARPDFETFSWRGASFDRDILRRVVRSHPGYNETLVEQFR